MALPLTVWLGIFTIISLFITIVFGILMTKGKQTFKLHKWFAYLTVILAIAHAVLVIYRFYF